MASMAERFADQQRLANGEDIGDIMDRPQGNPSRETYDLEDHQQRTQWMTDRVTGRLNDAEAANAVDIPSMYGGTAED
jgi:hypothetical protein